MIRKLGQGDLHHWKDIRRAALSDAPRAFIRTLASFELQEDAEHLVRLKNTVIFGAFDDDRIVGSASWHTMGDEVEAHRGRVTSVFVRAEARGTGAANELISEVIRSAIGHVLQLELEVGVENPSAIALYKRHGFDVVGTLPRTLCHNGVFVDAHTMMRRLDA